MNEQQRQELLGCIQQIEEVQTQLDRLLQSGIDEADIIADANDALNDAEACLQAIVS